MDAFLYRVKPSLFKIKATAAAGGNAVSARALPQFHTVAIVPVADWEQMENQ